MKPIPFRDRLVVRLAVGMLSVALLSLLLMMLLQFLSITLSDIQPPKLRERMQAVIEANPDNEELTDLLQMPRRVQRVLLQGSIFGILASVLLWIFFAFRFSRSIATPIEDVTLAAAQITHGDLAIRVQIPHNAKGEPVRLLEHFNQMAVSLEAYEKERTEMIASIAHELRTPLAVTRSRLELMEEGIVELSQSEVKRMSRQVDLLTRLVNDLRTLSLADANRLSLNLSNVQLNELVENVVESLQIRAKEQGVNLEFESESVLLKADADRLSQVVFNLLDNALKYTPSGGSVQLSLQKIGSSAQLTVRDTGEGFEGDADELFRRFYTTRQGTGSSGIGLALVKTIVDLHGGMVTADNAAEGGAVFTVQIPVT